MAQNTVCYIIGKKVNSSRIEEKKPHENRDDETAQSGFF